MIFDSEKNNQEFAAICNTIVSDERYAPLFDVAPSDEFYTRDDENWVADSWSLRDGKVYLHTSGIKMMWDERGNGYDVMIPGIDRSYELVEESSRPLTNDQVYLQGPEEWLHELREEYEQIRLGIEEQEAEIAEMLEEAEDLRKEDVTYKVLSLLWMNRCRIDIDIKCVTSAGSPFVTDYIYVKPGDIDVILHNEETGECHTLYGTAEFENDDEVLMRLGVDKIANGKSGFELLCHSRRHLSDDLTYLTKENQY